MKRRKSVLATAAGLAAALVLSACGGGDSEQPSAAGNGSGTPTPGGIVKLMQISEPRSLDPAVVSNSWSTNPVPGNALYGTLVTTDIETGELRPSMAESFESTDGGATFTLKLRSGLTFTDGTPLNAEAVKFNWDRIKDPATASSSMGTAALIAETAVVDETTLTVTMAMPIPTFPLEAASTSLNWIASPTALAKGPEAFDANPVGAGPFTLASWSRGDRLVFEKNPDYWDAPKPYVDGIELTTHNDTNQRWNALTSGLVDGASETNSITFDKAETAGLDVVIAPMSGGQYTTMNTTRPPFDDVRARQAVSYAIDLDAVNDVTYQGKGIVPETLFTEDSPFYKDIPLHTHDPEKAQDLFDELAAEGKPVSFTFKTYPTAENQAVAQSFQAQLAAFENVTVEVEVLDFANGPATMASKDFDMVVSAANLLDPDPRLWLTFHSTSRSNFSGLSDPELDDALLAGRTGATLDERVAAYETVQQRLAELVPGIWYGRPRPGFVANDKLHGVVLYGLGSPLPEEMWLDQ